MKIDPITAAKPTNAQLAVGINQVHACFEEHKTQTSNALGALRSDVDTVKSALGLADDSKRKVAGLSSPLSAFGRTVLASVTAIGAVTLIYRMVAALAPGAWHFLLVVNDAILSGKF